MNKALLGRQAWRMITKPKALMVSTLLSKYCKNELFTKVKPKPGNSWIRKSLSSGRDVVLKGIDIQVWSGKQTSFSTGVFGKCDSGRSHNAPNLLRLICPISHTWKTTYLINNDENNLFQQSIFHTGR